MKISNDKLSEWKSIDFQNIYRYLNLSRLHAQVYNVNDKVSLSLLHAFGNNLVKKISGTKYYLPLKYPLKTNIKTIKK